MGAPAPRHIRRAGRHLHRSGCGGPGGGAARHADGRPTDRAFNHEGLVPSEHFPQCARRQFSSRTASRRASRQSKVRGRVRLVKISVDSPRSFGGPSLSHSASPRRAAPPSSTRRKACRIGRGSSSRTVELCAAGPVPVRTFSEGAPALSGPGGPAHDRAAHGRSRRTDAGGAPSIRRGRRPRHGATMAQRRRRTHRPNCGNRHRGPEHAERRPAEPKCNRDRIQRASNTTAPRCSYSTGYRAASRPACGQTRRARETVLSTSLRTRIAISVPNNRRPILLFIMVST